MAPSSDVSARLVRALALPLVAALGVAALVHARVGKGAPRAEAPLVLPRVQDGPCDGNVALATEPPPRPGAPERPLRVAVGERLSAAPLLLGAGGLQALPGTPLGERGLQLSVVRAPQPAARLGQLRRGELDAVLVPLAAWEEEPVGEPFLLAGWSRGLDGLQGQPGGRVAVVGAAGAWLWRALRAVKPALASPSDVVRAQGADEAASLLDSGAVQATVGPLPAWPEVPPVGTSADVPGGLAEVWVAAPGLRAAAPGALAALCAGSWDGLSVLAEDPAAAHRQLAAWLGREAADVRGELSRWRLAGFSDNALFFGLTGGPSTFEALAAPAPRVAAPGTTVASLADGYRGVPWARRWAVRGRAGLAGRSLLGQPVLLHAAQGERGLMPGDGLLLDGLAETLKEFPSTVLQAAPSPGERCAALLRAELRRGYGVAPERVVAWEGPPPSVPPAEAPSACAVQLRSRQP
jgi:hypothetical protein